MGNMDSRARDFEVIGVSQIFKSPASILDRNPKPVV